MKYYLAVRNNEVMQITTMWTDTVLGEVSHSHKETRVGAQQMPKGN